MIKRFFLCVGILLVHYAACCQKANDGFTTDYTPMESRGAIPVEFITPIKSRVIQAVQGIDTNKTDKRITRRDKKDFLLESNNEVDLYLKSGHVIFNDEVNAYINKVAATILPQDAQSRNVRFYVIKYDYANAFTFNEGVIFINVGLIARCNNEAELAAVLGHEYAHYIWKHSINYHTEVKKSQRGEGSYRKKSLDDKKSMMLRYSKDNETEADLYGYELLQKSRYNQYAMVGLLRGLEYSNAVPVFCAFDKSLLEKGTVRIPRIYLYENRKDTAAARKKNADEEEDGAENEDENSSHPSLKERVTAVLNRFNPNDTAGKVVYLAGMETFERIRTMCRFEMCRIYLQRNNLDNAFCLTSCMLEEYPDNVYLNRIMATILYRMAKYANDRKLKDYVVRVEKADEEMKASNYLLRKFEKEELTLVALRYAWYANKKFPGNPDIEKVTREVLDMYTGNYMYNLNLFADLSKFNDTIVDHLYEKKNQPAPEQFTKTGKKKKITPRRKNVYRFDESLSLFALADLKNDPEFVKAFEESAKRAAASEQEMAAEEEESDSEEATAKQDDPKQSITTSNDRNKAKEKDEQQSEEGNQGINSLIVIEPEFELADQRKRIEKNYIVNDEEEAQIRNAIIQCATKAGFGMTLLNANSINAGETQKFNDYCCLKEFVVECFDQEGEPNIPTDYSKLKEIGKRYNSRYAAVLINRSLIYRRSWYEFILPLYLSIVNPVITIPWLGTKFFPHKEYVYIIGVMDLEENKLVYGDVLSFNRKERPDLFKSQFYATLIALKGMNR